MDFAHSYMVGYLCMYIVQCDKYCTYDKFQHPNQTLYVDYMFSTGKNVINIQKWSGCHLNYY